MRITVFILVFLIFSVSAHAQEGAGGGGFIIGPHFGRLLPNQIDGVTEIMALGGLRMGYDMGTSIIEAGFITGNGEGAEWKNLHISIMAKMPVEDIIGIVYIGGDITQYAGGSVSETVMGGGHVGGGIMLPLARGIHFRGDMKFNVNPGTSMYLGFGLDFELNTFGSSSSN